jgi:hypothetical protein
MKILCFFLALLAGALAQPLFVLDWVEGDLNGDGVPERVMLVSPDSSDPAHPRSRKQLLVMAYHKQSYRQVFHKNLEAGFFCKSFKEKLTQPQADFWGLHFLGPHLGLPPRVKVVFTPGSGEFFTLVHDGSHYQIESSGD